MVVDLGSLPLPLLVVVNWMLEEAKAKVPAWLDTWSPLVLLLWIVFVTVAVVTPFEVAAADW